MKNKTNNQSFPEKRFYQAVKMLLLSALAVSFLVSCTNMQKSSPVTHLSMDVGMMKRSDYQILGTVEGQSRTQSFLFGLIKIIDGNKLRMFWYLPFYQERYVNEGGIFFFLPPSASERAYYKTISANPDADSIITRAKTEEASGVWPIYTSETVTYTGKAIKLKSDDSLGKN